jgi:acyl-CoA thioester hydrolase
MAQNKQLFREDFPTFIEMPTRWMDNDAYGHMNNIVHYALIDTAVTDWQRNHGFFNEDHKCLEFMVVESGCCYFSEAAYPDKIAIGLRIKKMGSTSWIYQAGLFREDDELCFALGFFAQVLVDCENRRPTPIPNTMRDALKLIEI